MTNEEAIAVLKGYIENPLVDDTRAFEMAIQALSQESCDKCEVGNPCLYCKHEFSQKIEPCDDAISRDAVIKGIEELKRSPWATANRSHGYEYLITEALDVVKDLCVKQLPSVTQKSAESEDKTE